MHIEALRIHGGLGWVWTSEVRDGVYLRDFHVQGCNWLWSFRYWELHWHEDDCRSRCWSYTLPSRWVNNHRRPEGKNAWEDQKGKGTKQKPCEIDLVLIMIHSGIKQSGHPVELQLMWRREGSSSRGGRETACHWWILLIVSSRKGSIHLPRSEEKE